MMENMERLRQQLEENNRKLQSSLRYWQISEAEYEGLKEEVEALDDDSAVGVELVSCLVPWKRKHPG